MKLRPAVKERVVVVMPAFNAEQTLQKTVEAIPSESAQEIVVVDDASRDRTVDVARRLGLTIVVHQSNRGYGANQKTCYREALERGADIVVMVHPDFQYDPSRIPDMVRPIAQGTADVVIGSRFLETDPRSGGMDWWRYVGNRFLTSVQNYWLGLKLSECHSGYRAYHRRVLEQVPFESFADDFVFDSQMIVALAAFRFRITEIPVPTRYASDSSSIGFWPSVKYGFRTLTTLHLYARFRRKASGSI